jgi:hypothetical protein
MWGEGKFGQLGLASREEIVRFPICISDLSENQFFGQQRIIQVACGSRHSIFLTGNNSLTFALFLSLSLSLSLFLTYTSSLIILILSLISSLFLNIC